MEKKMTAFQAKSYLDGEGAVCPYCSAPDISGGPLEVDGGVATQTIRCSSCDEQWIDVYSLVGVCQADGERVEPTSENICPWKDTCRESNCAIWDPAAERCSLLSIAINSRRL
jgi:hypothetical protein